MRKAVSRRSFLRAGIGAGIVLAAPARWTRVLADNLSVERFGAIADGRTPCDRAFRASQDWVQQEVADGRTGRPVPLSAGTYLINESVTIADYGGFVGDGRASVYLPASSFNNSDPRPHSRYGRNAVAFDMSGQLNGALRPRAKPTLAGFNIRYEVRDGRVLRAVVALNASDVTIKGLEIAGFPVGVAICVATLSGRSEITSNFVHDGFSDNTDVARGDRAFEQITGIEVDNDVIGRVASRNILIQANRVWNLKLGTEALHAYDYQTDGINVANSQAKGFLILDNDLRGVAEGIDHFGSGGVLAANTTSDTYNFGIKLTHGAQDNKIYGNRIVRPGLAGITIANGPGDPDTTGNEIYGNSVVDVDDVAGYVGAWAAGGHETSCIDFRSTGTGLVHDNRVYDNVLDPGPRGALVFRRASKDGRHNDLLNNRVVRRGRLGLIANLNGDGGRLTLAP